MAGGTRTRVEVDGIELSLSNLDKVLWPATGHTKAHLVRHAAAVAEVQLPQLADRPITWHRVPDGIGSDGFWEKRLPDHAPDWVESIDVVVGGEVIQQPTLRTTAGLLWAANLGAIELHVPLATSPRLERPRWVVFDLDPGEGADVTTCATVAMLLRTLFERLGLESWVKLSGSKGIHLLVPVSEAQQGELTFPATRTFAHSLATLLHRAHDDLVVVGMSKDARQGRVLVDWRQNEQPRTMVAPWSVRIRERPTVSVPLSWDDVSDMAEGAPEIVVDIDGVPAWIASHGHLLDGLLTTDQTLPAITVT